MKAKIVSIIGTRPQLIKVAEMDKVIQAHSDFIHFIIHTGQHFDKNMSGDFFKELDIPEPHAFLNINSGTHGQNTGAMIPKIEELLDSMNPAIVLVYGDCDSTLAGTIAAKKMDIPVAHIEAGIRSGDMRMPEEQNRVMVDSVCDLLFTPTQNACDILEREGGSTRIFNCGDLMYDSFRRYEGRIAKNETPSGYYFATIHRKENTNNSDNLKSIISGMGNINATVFLAIHPRTDKAMQLNNVSKPRNVRIIAPLSYSSTLSFIKYAKAVITDSGGIQKEAFWLKTPCVTLRNSTEWPETVDSGWNILTGADRDRIKTAIKSYSMVTRKNPPGFLYGSGMAGTKILSVIKQFLNNR